MKAMPAVVFFVLGLIALKLNILLTGLLWGIGAMAALGAVRGDDG